MRSEVSMNDMARAASRLWTLRASVRNSLSRSSDHVRIIASILAIVAALVCVPVAFAIGAEVYATRERAYAVRADASDGVPGIGLEPGGRSDFPGGQSITRAQWNCGRPVSVDASWSINDTTPVLRVEACVGEQGQSESAIANTVTPRRLDKGSIHE